MPAAKLRPVRPSTTTVPPVMYSQPWSPVPSITALAPELRTQNRSPGDAAEVRFALDRAVHHRVADDDVLLRLRRARGIRVDDDAAAGQTLADVVVGRTLQLERDAAREKRAEALARDAFERDVDRVLGQALVAVLARERRPDSIAPTERLALRMRCVSRTGCCFSSAGLRRRDQLVVERAREAVILLFLLRTRDFRRHLRLMEDAREVEAARLPVRDARAHVEQIGAADHLLERAEAQLRHELAHFLGDEEEDS